MMKTMINLLLLVGSFSGGAGAGVICATDQCEEARKIPTLPIDVKSFVERRDGCDHFRGEPWDIGEEPEIKERREFILENIKNLCAGTDKQLKELRAKYADDAVVSDLLKEYEEQSETQ